MTMSDELQELFGELAGGGGQTADRFYKMGGTGDYNQSRFEKMGGTPMTPEQERTKGPMIGRGSRGGETDEMEKLFEELMGGDTEGAEGSEEFDWEGLWNSLMEEEEGGENVQGSQYPSMFGAPIRPAGFNRGSDFNFY